MGSLRRSEREGGGEGGSEESEVRGVEREGGGVRSGEGGGVRSGEGGREVE